MCLRTYIINKSDIIRLIIIIKLSESKTTKGTFTYYIITEEGKGSLKGLCMTMGEGEGVGLVMTYANKFFLQIEIVFKYHLLFY